MIVDVLCRPGRRRVPLRLIRETARRVLRSEGWRDGQASILLTGDSEIRALNARYRRVDSATDVLSFPASARPVPGGHLGDVVISVESAARQAREAGWRLEEEVRFLVIHGMLHLLGHDHESDRGEMNRLQAGLARRILRREIPEVRVSATPPSSVRRRRRRRIAS
jgi:probable rRNA maturation factor